MKVAARQKTGGRFGTRSSWWGGGLLNLISLRTAPRINLWQLDRIKSSRSDDRAPQASLQDAKIFRRGLAAALDHLIGDLLTIIEALEARTFHGADMHKDVATALVRLNKPITSFPAEITRVNTSGQTAPL